MTHHNHDGDKWHVAEELNGRLAMLGFVIAVGTYLTTGQIIPGILQSTNATFYMKVIDDFLAYNEFAQIRDFILSSEFPWGFTEIVSDSDNDYDGTWNYKHCHVAFDYVQISSTTQALGHYIQHPIIDCKALKRIIINSYPWTPKVMSHAPHTDYPFSHKGALLNLTTCDGYTYVENQKVESVANRVILFDPSIPHYGTTTSSHKRRIVVNMNYF